MKKLLMLFMMVMLLSSCEEERLRKLEESKKDSLRRVEEVYLKVGDTLFVNKYPNSKFSKTDMTVGYIMNDRYQITTDNHDVIQRIVPMEEYEEFWHKFIPILFICITAAFAIKTLFFD